MCLENNAMCVHAGLASRVVLTLSVSKVGHSARASGLSRWHVLGHSSRWSAGDGCLPPPPAAAWPASFLPALGNQPGPSLTLLTEAWGVAPQGPRDMQPGWHLFGSA